MNRRQTIRAARAIAAGCFAGSAIGALINTLTHAPDPVMWWNAIVLLCAALAYSASSLINRRLRRTDQANQGPQVPLNDPVARAENKADAARRGRGKSGNDWLPAGHPDHHHDEGL